MMGYAVTEGVSAADAFVNAATILSGISGLFVVIATGFVLAPVLHRVLHSFRVEKGKDDDD
ncbi:hypothetical protein DWF00_07485 [Bosea caraganae]|uniref:Uncharacterized protein n=1 Tax=Bosea caraganae TaxID=2763117 RepID=A0A370L157_9HYPH|nr:hypothetical protein [Bosea caraganae]RDJ21055.1 hypothetical protein DWE98_22280 [Bosea caraganae]RDJ28554.1 hypothetical protein DWF00_07485 [Bosea caraganae]